LEKKAFAEGDSEIEKGGGDGERQRQEKPRCTYRWSRVRDLGVEKDKAILFWFGQKQELKETNGAIKEAPLTRGGVLCKRALGKRGRAEAEPQGRVLIKLHRQTLTLAGSSSATKIEGPQIPICSDGGETQSKGVPQEE